jgi:putative DNA primase/helicase
MTSTNLAADGAADTADPPALVIALHRDRGWALIPVRDKRPMVDWKAYQEQRPSRAKMTVWQCQYEPPSWAVVTGAESGVIVLDFDGERGLETLAELGFEPHVTTPRGGAHVYFEHPGIPVLTRAPVDGDRWPSMDVRGDRGLAIVCGRDSRGGYVWHDREPYPWSRLPHELADALTATTVSAISTPRIGRRVPEGGRHSHLLSFAGKLAAVGATGDAIEAAVVAENAAACDPPMSDVEARDLGADAARRYGETRRYALTDFGNAERLADIGAGELIYVPGVGWHNWDGKRYRHDEDDVEVTRRAAAAARSQYRALLDEGNDNDRSAQRKWAVQSESRRGIEAAIKLARVLPGITTSPDQLDADPWLINVQNGTLDLRTATLRPHDPGDLITKLAGAGYDPEATLQLWEDFLDQTTGGDTGLQWYLAQTSGYSLTGLTLAEVLFFFHGPGGSGKTTYAEAMRSMMGDYAIAASFETLTRSRKGGGASNDIADLVGVRVAIAGEVDEGQSFNAGTVKSLTGGDTVRSRRLYHESFEFRPQCKLWFAANERPSANAADDAFWRRMRQIPFLRSRQEQEQDPSVKQRLTTDPDARAAILAWAVRGCLDWQQNGFAVPDCVRRHTREYRTENDPIQRWLDERYVLEDAGFTPAKALTQSWLRWWEQNGERGRELSWQKVTKRLRELGCADSRHASERGWLGISRRSSADDDRDDGNDIALHNSSHARGKEKVSETGVIGVISVTETVGTPQCPHFPN